MPYILYCAANKLTYGNSLLLLNLILQQEPWLASEVEDGEECI